MPTTIGGPSVKVLHVISTLPGYGAENFVHSLLPELRREGHDVAVLTVYGGAHSAEAPESEDIPIFSVARQGRYDLQFFGRMVAIMRRWRPTIVHTHTHNGKYWGRLAALVAGVRIIVHTEHDSKESRSAVERVANLVLHPQTARIIALSEKQRDLLRRIEPLPVWKIEIIPNGITQESVRLDRRRCRDRFGLSDDTFAVAMAGRLGPEKNYALALRAFAKLPDIAASSRLLIAGSGVLRAELTDLAAALRLDKNVAFMGYLPDTKDLLAAADVFLTTSTREAMPLALLQAMSAGVPIVSTPWVGAHEILQRGRLGTLTEDWSPRAVAAAVAHIRQDPLTARKRADHARAVAASNYDIRTTARRYSQLYCALLDGKSRRLDSKR